MFGNYFCLNQPLNIFNLEVSLPSDLFFFERGEREREGKIREQK